MGDAALAAGGLCILVSGLIGSWTDVRERRLPNWLSGLTLVAGLTVSFALGGAEGLMASALHFALALAMGIVLTALGMVGAGDAKYYAAMAGFFSWRDAAALTGFIGIGGLVLLVAWFSYRQLARARYGAANTAQGQLPFGVAIALGSVLAWASLAIR